MKIKAVECIRTWNGEIFSGEKILLIRFKKCNRNCPNCDTRDKINNFVEGEYSIDEIQSNINLYNLNLVISGGEPTYGKNFDYTKILLNQIECKNKYVETNGYDLLCLYEYCKNVGNVKYIYSPKFSDDLEDRVIKRELEKTINLLQNIQDGKLIIKVVYDEHSGYYISELLRTVDVYRNMYKKPIPDPIIYVMPEGKTKEEVMMSAKKAFEFANKYGLNITTRMHLIHNFE